MNDNEIAQRLVQIARNAQPDVSVRGGKLTFKSGNREASYTLYPPRVVSEQVVRLR